MAEINIEKMAQNVAKKAIQELENNGVFVGRWISVEEDAPPVGVVCLWCNKQGNVFTSAITYRTENISYVGQHGHFSNGLENYGNIVAWMPLPKPFESEESDEGKE